MFVVTLFSYKYCVFLSPKKCTDWNSCFLPLGSLATSCPLYCWGSSSVHRFKKWPLRYGDSSFAVNLQNMLSANPREHSFPLPFFSYCILLWYACRLSSVTIGSCKVYLIESGCKCKFLYSFTETAAQCGRATFCFPRTSTCMAYCVLLLVIRHPHSVHLRVLESVA